MIFELACVIEFVSLSNANFSDEIQRLLGLIADVHVRLMELIFGICA